MTTGDRTDFNMPIGCSGPSAYSDLKPVDHPVEGGDTCVPSLGRVNRYNKPWLVICETHFCLPEGSLREGMPSEDPLGMEPFKDQLND